MRRQILNSFEIVLASVREAVEDVPDDLLAAQPAGVPNHPLWTLGHLTSSFEAIAIELGADPWLPDDWNPRFGTRSQPGAPRSDPGVREDALARVNDAAARAAASLNACSDLDAELPDERHRPIFPTVGHAAMHILVGHTAVHLGQLLVWRRAMELPPISSVL